MRRVPAADRDILLNSLLLFLSKEQVAALREALKKSPDVLMIFDNLYEDIIAWKEPSGSPVFAKALNYFYSRCGKRGVDIYEDLGVNKGTWSRWLNGENEPLNRDSVLSLCALLELGEYESIFLLGSAGYALRYYDPRDRMIIQCLRDKVYSPAKIDEILYDARYELLFGKKNA